MAAEREVQLPHAPPQAWAHKPPRQPAKCRSSRRQDDLVVNLVGGAGPVIVNRILQAQPAIAGVADARFKLDGKLLIIKVQGHFALEVSARSDDAPAHHGANVQWKSTLDCRPSSGSTTTVSTHC